MHRLLRRQLKKHLGFEDEVAAEISGVFPRAGGPTALANEAS